MNMKYKIILGIVIFTISGFMYFKKNFYIDAVDNEWLILNPLAPKQSDYDYYCLNADIYFKRGDSRNYKYFSSKILEFKDTHNEVQYERLFSCGNGYWEYKQKKLLNYSRSYEAIGNIDSAISCLKDGLFHFEKYKNEIDRRFFQLQIKKQGKDRVIEEISRGVNNIDKLDCFMCNNYYFKFEDYKIGIDLNNNDNDKLLSDLLMQYGI